LYNGIRKIEEVIDYIESNITDELDYNLLASKMSLSVYEFRRIFSFIVDCPVSEYVRKRKLSLAALDIMTTDKPDLLKISEKYGYSNQSAFSRAFYEQHGIYPSACIKGSSEINLFTRPKLELSMQGGESIPMKIIRSESFYIKGYSDISPITDSCCCENVWNAFYDGEYDKKLSGDKIYVSYFNKGSNVECCIGEISVDGILIPNSRWACFKADTVDDDIINEKYSKIIYEWLPSANLKINNDLPTIEVYPYDMSEDGFEWEIRIPIE